jgi:Phage 5-bladed beta propeller receptor binding platform domain
MPTLSSPLAAGTNNWMQDFAWDPLKDEIFMTQNICTTNGRETIRINRLVPLMIISSMTLDAGHGDVLGLQRRGNALYLWVNWTHCSGTTKARATAMGWKDRSVMQGCATLGDRLWRYTGNADRTDPAASEAHESLPLGSQHTHTPSDVGRSLAMLKLAPPGCQQRSLEGGTTPRRAGALQIELHGGVDSSSRPLTRFRVTSGARRERCWIASSVAEASR